ncbi:peptidyl-prolyl cis-trans isomerase [Holotrichia oblita]|uniref:Peptidyl-prolyl cis-trans isomerase n=1 Tax=Holotrichia oblita TaxID=644536 RepID=A0ACB9TBG2_HOLOL|nr:peptidyl-prolyl cis-trans isomerase [Holotrichia oblita]
MIQGGDILFNNGSGSVCIYGDHFEDENFNVKHSGSGYISMANYGPDSNGCQFFITTIATPWLDDNHVVFGKVVYGEAIVHKIEHLKTDVNDKPLKLVQIIKSGLIPTPKPFYISDYNYG